MANGTLIGAIRVDASLDAGKFVEGAKKVRQETKQTEQTVKQSFSGLGAAVKGGIAGFVGALSVGVLTAGIKAALDYAAGLKALAQQAGVTARDLQELRYAAAQNGVSQQQLEQGLQRMNTALDKAAGGSKTARAAFAAVGVSLDDIANKTNRQIFEQIADGMRKQGGAAKNAAAATTIFGESASRLNPLLNQGSEGINELAAAAQELGIVLSDEQIEKADQTANKLEAIKTVLASRIAGVVADNADAILALADALEAIVSAAAGAANAMRSFYGVVSSGLGAAQSGAPRAFAAAQDAMNALFPGSGALLGALTPSGGGSARNPGGSLGAFAGGMFGGGGRDIASIPGKKGRGAARSRRGPRDRSDDVAYQVERELLQADLDILRAMQELAGDATERANLSTSMLDIERQLFRMEQDDKVRRAVRDQAEGKITEATLAQVKAGSEAAKAKFDQAQAYKQEAIDAEEAASLAADVTRLQSVSFDLQEEALRDMAVLATTASDRREIELRLLDIARQREQLEINELAASKDAADQEEARRRQAALNRSYGAQRQSVINGTRGPLEQWAATIPQTAAEINEALQSIQVEGIEGLADAIGDVITGTKSMAEAFGDLANQVIADILRMTIRMLIFKAISSAIGGGFGGGDVGPQSVDWSAAGVPQFATGGSFTVLGRRGVDKNMLSLNGLPIAKVSHGERIGVATGADGGSRPIHFDLRGAVLTTDLLAQMNAMAGGAAGQGAMLGAAGGVAGIERRRSRTIP